MHVPWQYVSIITLSPSHSTSEEGRFALRGVTLERNLGSVLQKDLQILPVSESIRNRSFLQSLRCVFEG